MASAFHSKQVEQLSRGACLKQLPDPMATEQRRFCSSLAPRNISLVRTRVGMPSRPETIGKAAGDGAWPGRRACRPRFHPPGPLSGIGFGMTGRFGRGDASSRSAFVRSSRASGDGGAGTCRSPAGWLPKSAKTAPKRRFRYPASRSEARGRSPAARRRSVTGRFDPSYGRRRVYRNVAVASWSEHEGLRGKDAPVVPPGRRATMLPGRR
jgi:hypothetical protein